MFAPYFVIVHSKAGIIQNIQMFTEEDRAIGYAQTMYGGGKGGTDDAVVFVVDPETGQGDEIFTVYMEDYSSEEDIDENDDELDVDFSEEISMLSSEFSLVDVEKLYGEAQLPPMTSRKSLKVGSVVVVECATMDTHEKCLVEITKVSAGKRYRYEGALVSLPEHFEVPPKSKIKFSEANVLSIL